MMDVLLVVLAVYVAIGFVFGLPAAIGAFLQAEDSLPWWRMPVLSLTDAGGFRWALPWGWSWPSLVWGE